VGWAQQAPLSPTRVEGVLTPRVRSIDADAEKGAEAPFSFPERERA
jgi:hypothetical protein